MHTITVAARGGKNPPGKTCGRPHAARRFAIAVPLLQQQACPAAHLRRCRGTVPLLQRHVRWHPPCAFRSLGAQGAPSAAAGLERRRRRLQPPARGPHGAAAAAAAASGSRGGPAAAAWLAGGIGDLQQGQPRGWWDGRRTRRRRCHRRQSPPAPLASALPLPCVQPSRVADAPCTIPRGRLALGCGRKG